MIAEWRVTGDATPLPLPPALPVGLLVVRLCTDRAGTVAPVVWHANVLPAGAPDRVLSLSAVDAAPLLEHGPRRVWLVGHVHGAPAFTVACLLQR